MVCPGPAHHLEPQSSRSACTTAPSAAGTNTCGTLRSTLANLHAARKRSSCPSVVIRNLISPCKTSFSARSRLGPRSARLKVRARFWVQKQPSGIRGATMFSAGTRGGLRRLAQRAASFLWRRQTNSLAPATNARAGMVILKSRDRLQGALLPRRGAFLLGGGLHGHLALFHCSGSSPVCECVNLPDKLHA